MFADIISGSNQRKERRSERRLENSLTKSVLRHQIKLDEGLVSLAPEYGELAVVASRGTTTNSTYSATEQIAIFQNEAERVAVSGLAAAYNSAKVYHAASKLDIDLLLMEPEVSGIVIVGHGTIAGMRLHQDKHMNWQEVSRSATHLKLGQFVQRMCGHFHVEESIAMGTFAVADQRNVIAPLGVPIDDKYPDEDLFKPVYQNAVNDTQTLIDFRNNHMPRSQNGGNS